MVKCKNCKQMIWQKVNSTYTTTEYPYCNAFEECIDDIDKEIACGGFEAMTNAERIRSMTDEELAEFLKNKLDSEILCENHEEGCWYKCKTRECNYDDTRLIIKWLKAEVGV